jgi:hypothetical protein
MKDQKNEINDIYNHILSTPKKELEEEWMKVLKQDFETTKKRLNRQRKNETLFDPSDFEVKEALYKRKR